MRPTAQPLFLLVSDARADSLREAMNPLVESGARVELVADVYSAMARISIGERFSRVLLDVRSLDTVELSFHQLAPRYFPEVTIDIPWLNGTSQALVRLGRPDLPTIEIASIIEAASASSGAIVESAPPPMNAIVRDPVAPEIDQPRRPLSTDSLETIEGEVSLHDAVRNRMAENAEGAPARRPPSRTPPGSRTGPSPQAANLTPEELETLLDEGTEDERTQP
ncbi:MAG: hypothetical protein HZA51_16695 [Planctomycetes bacterium]|nr:hypothetical protein [Planctomycetota bacterium]